MKTITIFCLVLISLIACKKTIAPLPDPLINNGNNNGISTYGDIETLYIQEYNKNIFMGNDSIVISSFYDNLVDGLSPVNYVNAGIVNYNGINLKPSATYYRDTTRLVNIHNLNSVWTVSGSANVPSFSYTYTPSYPIFLGNAQLPDSLSILHGVTINVSGISNMSQASIPVTISQGTVNITKSILINQTSCTFTPAELTSLSPSQSVASIILIFSKISNQTFAGKAYGIVNALEHIKYGVKIKP